MPLIRFLLSRSIAAIALLWAAIVPVWAGSGTAGDPFTALAEANNVPSSGRYFFNLGSGTFAADVDTSEGGGWVLVLQYVHQGGTNPALSIRAAGANLPVTSTAALGANESSIADRWGHAGNGAMNQFGGDIETRWFGQTSNHARIVHFRTSIGNDYFRSGTGSMAGISTGFTALTGHTANIPGSAGSAFLNKGAYALTNFPFFQSNQRHWGIRGEANDAIGGLGNNGNRWEVDDFPNDFSRSTIHRIWVRAANPTVVSTTSNSGSGSLRDTIMWANGRSGTNTITFAIPGAGPHTITLSSVLPVLTANGLIIDGTTQSGTQCRDLWAGSGHDLRVNVRGSSGFDGFRMAGSNQTVRGLSITGFENAIRPLSGSSNTTIQCNYLGLLANGTSSGNTRGAWLFGAGARIGGLDPGQGNVISANSIAGLVTDAPSTDTAIRGNFIGTDPTGMTARANGTGINNGGGSSTWLDITYNLISGNNGNAGIMLENDDRISPSNGLIRIQRNRIGFTRNLSGLLRNGGDGIGFRESSISNVLIGGDTSTEGNEITGTDDAVDLRQVSSITIQGNTIARAVGRGVWLNNVSSATVGGTLAAQGNVIGGNGTDGIRADAGSSGIVIHGNQIGAVTITGGTFQNTGRGIFLENVSNITIGNGAASGRNVLASNGDRAIMGVGTNSTITINGNYIGTNATGNAAVSNGANAGVTVRDAISFDSGGSFTNLAILNNVIGGYADAQLELFVSTGNGITIQGNNIGVGADGVSSIVSGNAQELVRLGGGGTYSNLLIGGSGAGQGNILANSSQHGLLLDTGGSNIQVIGNTIRNNALNGVNVMNATRAALLSNRIFSNGQIGIDLSNNGVTLNDSGDGDAGPNNLLNFPAITAVNVTSANQLIYSFSFDGPADANGYRVEFFANSAADASGYGEGETYLGHVDIVHNGGSQSYSGTMTSLVPISIGSIISATATRKTAGGAWDITSEFSATATAQGVAQLNVAVTTEPYDQGSGAGFSTPGSDVSLTATVTNTGSGSTQSNSIFTVISINNVSSFFNAETPAFGGVVRFTSTSPMLTFTPGTDMRFSNAATAPTEFAQCTYTPAAGYDPLVRFVCLNPKGSLPHSAPQNQFSVQLRARIN